MNPLCLCLLKAPASACHTQNCTLAPQSLPINAQRNRGLGSGSSTGILAAIRVNNSAAARTGQRRPAFRSSQSLSGLLVWVAEWEERAQYDILALLRRRYRLTRFLAGNGLGCPSPRAGKAEEGGLRFVCCRAGGRLCAADTPPAAGAAGSCPCLRPALCSSRRSALRLLRRARFPPGAGLRFGGSGPARQGRSQRWTGHHCYLKPCWKAAKGECPGHLRLVRPAAAGALCVFTPQPAGPCCARFPFSKGACWSAPCPHSFCSVFRGLAGVPPPPGLLAWLSLPDRTEARCSFKESRLLTVTHFWLSARKIASAWPTEKKPNNFSFVCGVTFHCPPIYSCPFKI